MRSFAIVFLLFAISFCQPQQLFSQNTKTIAESAKQTIEGTVTDEQGKPLAGAAIQIVDTYLGTFSGKKGNFKFSKGLKDRSYVLEIFYTGYNKQNVSVRPGETVNIKLIAGLLLGEAMVLSPVEVDAWTPVAYDELNENEIEARNLGQDLPYLLRFSPSVVVTSDAGTGIGYTGIRVRGSDPTRINVTINGIPLNDSESQGTFWVNLPDFATSVDNIQLQRGVGTSTNGAGAFGASIDLKTGGINEEAYGRVSNSFGSFNTRKHNLELGTGLLGGHFTVDGRLSTIKSDGFIDRATVDLNSYYLAAAYLDGENLLRVTVFSGKEVTYQAWGGVPEAYLEIDSLRTHNPYTYENEVDDYGQDHYQLHYTRVLSGNWDFQTAGHYTKGAGFFEQFRQGDELADYGLENVLIGADTVSSTDLIRRRWLDNDFYGFTTSLNFDAGSGVRTTLGGAWNNYIGKHFGEVVWAEYASNGDIGHRYYDNDADKTDFNVFAKLHWQFADQFGLYGDLQYRSVNYTFEGFNDNTEIGTQSAQLGFFNPKAGIVYQGKNGSSAYASFAVGGKEPNRDDYTESSPQSRPKAERLYDLELGYGLAMKNISLQANAYYMYYKDQLILTGQVNDVGAYTRTNVDQSYRSGLELSGVYKKGAFQWDVNLSLSSNRILDFTEFVDNWDTWRQEEIAHGDQPLSFSPAVIAGSQLSYDFLAAKGSQLTTSPSASSASTKSGSNGSNEKWLRLGLLSKYVGKQYIDNTGSEERALDSYFVNDVQLRLGAESVWKFTTVELNLMVRNLLNEQYESNAWVYRYISGGESAQLSGFYPQAGTNFLLGLTVGF